MCLGSQAISDSEEVKTATMLEYESIIHSLVLGTIEAQTLPVTPNHSDSINPLVSTGMG